MSALVILGCFWLGILAFEGLVLVIEVALWYPTLTDRMHAPLGLLQVVALLAGAWVGIWLGKRLRRMLLDT